MKLTIAEPLSNPPRNFVSYERPAALYQGQHGDKWYLTLKFSWGEKDIAFNDKDSCDRMFKKIEKNIDDNVKGYYVFPTGDGTTEILTSRPLSCSYSVSEDADKTWTITINTQEHTYDHEFSDEREFTEAWLGLLRFIENS